MTATPTTEPKRTRVDSRTRYPGVFARHQLHCTKAVAKDKRCTCTPSYYGKVWDPAVGRHRPTERRPTIREAKNLRDDLQRRVRAGAVVDRPSGLTFEQAHEDFIADCKEGVALSKKGEPYTANAITDLNSSLNGLPDSIRKKEFAAVVGGELQEAVDKWTRAKLSSSRINSRINAVRSLYTWGKHRGKVAVSPATDLRLPVVKYTESRRIAKPGEFADLIDRLAPEDALPWAIAAYGTARHQEIQVLMWTEVDFNNDVMLLAEDDKARKSEAAWRVVPMVKPLRKRLRAEWVRQGKPKAGRVCPPRVANSKSGKLSLNQLLKRIKKKWEKIGLVPIGLQDSRHTAATWLDHAGVSPKVVSVFMGHKAPNRELHPGAAPITLRRYTHVLEGELERARDQLDAFLVKREEEEREAADRGAGA